MSEAATHPAELILKRCAEAAPQPWFPRAGLAGELDLRRAEDVLTELWTHGLIQRAGGDAEKGPAFTLTEDGRGLLADPEGLRRLREGHLPRTRIAEVRGALLRPGRPVVTYALIGVCVAWFLAGLVLAMQSRGVVGEYLLGFGRLTNEYEEVQKRMGAATGSWLLEGQWWRLLTNGFVHFGLLHLLMNMWVLHGAGRYVESMWGRGRYLVIYFLSLLGGSCLAMGYQPGALTAGASGAICGVLAAEAVWIFLNGKYLPEAMARRAKTSVVTTGVLIILISLLPFVSGWGHLGGALAGGAAALLFQVERSAPRPWAYAALLGLPVIPGLSWYAFEHGRRTDPDWARLAGTHRTRTRQQEKEDFEGRFLNQASDTYARGTLRRAERVYDEDVRPLLIRHPARRDPEEVKQALAELPGLRKEVESLAEAFEQAGPYEQHEIAENARKAGREWARGLARLLELSEECLRAGEDWPMQGDARIREQQEAVMKYREEWRKQMQ